MWFDELASREPDSNDLQAFVRLTVKFLEQVVFDRENRFSFLWAGNGLQEVAQVTFREDASPAGDRMIGALREYPESVARRLSDHGLFGRPLRFKFEVLKWIANQLFGALGKSPLSIRGLFKKLLDAIDVILDSLIDALGVGGALKEFKDALAALAIETPE